MNKYDSYKDSGIEWIGEIPYYWNIRKLKFICKIFNGDSLKDEEKELYREEIENSIPYVSTKDIDVWTSKINYENGLSIPIDHARFKIASKNSFLMCIEGGSAGRKHGLLEKDVFFVNKLACFETKSENNKFLYYYSQSPLFQSQFQNSLSGLIGGVAISQIRNFSAILPSLNEQIIIANYLDHKTSQIDSLISKKERLIQLLEEERIALINQAVTKGLDPSVPMKDSGIEWLGEIPKHWEAKKLRFIGDCQNGISAGAEYFGDGFPFVSYGDVYNNEILPQSVNGLAQSNEKEQLHYSIVEGDVLFTRTSETIDEIGIYSVCFKTIENVVFAGFLIRFRPYKNQLDKVFSKYFFRSIVPRTFFVKEMNLVTRASLSQELLKRLPILLPTLEEQKEIGSYLDMQTFIIEEKEMKFQKEISLLKEYKTALISEVVTGKVDVRNEKIN
jgi:type I restriction enzyme S subunit